MKQYKDPTKNAIRNVIEPALARSGFIRSNEKDFFRVRGELLDNIYFGFGRWGSDVIYIYFSVHLLIDPVTSIATYHVGDRLSAKWFPKDHDAASASAAAILEDIEKYAFEWFGQIDDVRKFEGAWFDRGSTAAFAAISQGDLGRAKIYLQDSLSRKAPLIYESGYPGWRENEYGIDLEKQHEIQRALDAIEAGTICQWKSDVINEKLKRLGIN